MLKHTLLLPFFLIGALLQAQTTVVDVVVNSDDHTLLEAAVLSADLAGTLSGDGPFTVFAPTDAAVTALVTELGITADDLLALDGLADILLYHVVGATAMSGDLSDGQMVTTLQGEDVTISIMGGNVMVNSANVTVADIAADNGVVHVIDAVLLPPPPATTTVVDVIVNSEDHNLLEAAVGAAGLVDALSGEGPFTVFAPTDDAVTALVTTLGITADDLLALEGLADILLYHVVNATALSGDLSDGQMITTMLGEDITISIMDGTVMVNDATVTVADITTDNGVVHVIDAVLLPPTPEVTPTVADIIAESEAHTVLAAVLDSTGLDEALAGDGPFTVFAPTDAAFDALPPAVILQILTDNALLTNILTYHVAGDSLTAGDLSDGMMIETLNGEEVTVTIMDGTVMINDATVIVADLIGSNGVVHVIDAILTPPAPTPATVVDIVVNSPNHNILETAVVAAGLVDALSGEGPFTVFAPTDMAFAALPAGVIDELLADPTGALTDILTYHVVGGAAAMSGDLSDGQMITTLNGQDVTVTLNGGNVIINNALVVVADLVADNGVVHVIDAVLLPEPPAPATVVDIIVNSEDHTILEAAVGAAGLVDALSGEGPFTVFAPTDAAFAALPAGLIDELLADPAGALTDILTYHVVGGAAAMSTDLTDGQTIATLQGEEVTISIDGMMVMVNDANVIVADLVADNGVVHVIDAVLSLPSGVDQLDLGSLFEVYPNPTTDVLRWGAVQVDRLQVLDANGRLCYETTNPTGVLDMSAFDNGRYVVVIEADGQRAVKAVIKQ